jgi:hypothetical protein
VSAEPADPTDFVILEKGLSRDEATSIACGLQSAGIPYAYGGIRRAQVSYARAIVASVDLIVRADQLAAAREAIAAYRRGDLSIDESFDPSVDA